MNKGKVSYKTNKMSGDRITQRIQNRFHQLTRQGIYSKENRKRRARGENTSSDGPNRKRKQLRDIRLGGKANSGGSTRVNDLGAVDIGNTHIRQGATGTVTFRSGKRKITRRWVWRPKGAANEDEALKSKQPGYNRSVEPTRRTYSKEEVDGTVIRPKRATNTKIQFVELSARNHNIASAVEADKYRTQFISGIEEGKQFMKKTSQLISKAKVAMGVADPIFNHVHHLKELDPEQDGVTIAQRKRMAGIAFFRYSLGRQARMHHHTCRRRSCRLCRFIQGVWSAFRDGLEDYWANGITFGPDVSSKSQNLLSHPSFQPYLWQRIQQKYRSAQESCDDIAWNRMTAMNKRIVVIGNLFGGDVNALMHAINGNGENTDPVDQLLDNLISEEVTNLAGNTEPSPPQVVATENQAVAFFESYDPGVEITDGMLTDLMDYADAQIDECPNCHTMLQIRTLCGIVLKTISIDTITDPSIRQHVRERMRNVLKTMYPLYRFEVDHHVGRKTWDEDDDDLYDGDNSAFGAAEAAAHNQRMYTEQGNDNYTQYLLAKSKKHNKLMHSTNGNTTETTKKITQQYLDDAVKTEGETGIGGVSLPKPKVTPSAHDVLPDSVQTKNTGLRVGFEPTGEAESLSSEMGISKETTSGEKASGGIPPELEVVVQQFQVFEALGKAHPDFPSTVDFLTSGPYYPFTRQVNKTSKEYYPTGIVGHMPAKARVFNDPNWESVPMESVSAVVRGKYGFNDISPGPLYNLAFGYKEGANTASDVSSVLRMNLTQTSGNLAMQLASVMGVDIKKASGNSSAIFLYRLALYMMQFDAYVTNPQPYFDGDITRFTADPLAFSVPQDPEWPYSRSPVAYADKNDADVKMSACTYKTFIEIISKLKSPAAALAGWSPGTYGYHSEEQVAVVPIRANMVRSDNTSAVVLYIASHMEYPLVIRGMTTVEMVTKDGTQTEANTSLHANSNFIRVPGPAAIRDGENTIPAKILLVFTDIKDSYEWPGFLGMTYAVNDYGLAGGVAFSFGDELLAQVTGCDPITLEASMTLWAEVYGNTDDFWTVQMMIAETTKMHRTPPRYINTTIGSTPCMMYWNSANGDPFPDTHGLYADPTGADSFEDTMYRYFTSPLGLRKHTGKNLTVTGAAYLNTWSYSIGSMSPIMAVTRAAYVWTYMKASSEFSFNIHSWSRSSIHNAMLLSIITDYICARMSIPDAVMMNWTTFGQKGGRNLMNELGTQIHMVLKDIWKNAWVYYNSLAQPVGDKYNNVQGQAIIFQRVSHYWWSIYMKRGLYADSSILESSMKYHSRLVNTGTGNKRWMIDSGTEIDARDVMYNRSIRLLTTANGVVDNPGLPESLRVESFDHYWVARYNLPIVTHNPTEGISRYVCYGLQVAYPTSQVSVDLPNLALWTFVDRSNNFELIRIGTANAPLVVSGKDLNPYVPILNLGEYRPSEVSDTYDAGTATADVLASLNLNG
jgi:hypothetical protein